MSTMFRSTRRPRSRITPVLGALAAAGAIAYFAAGMHAAVGTYVHFATHEPDRIEVRDDFDPQEHRAPAVVLGSGGGVPSLPMFVR